MNPRAAVAIILALGVVVVLLSGTPLRFLVVDGSVPENQSPEAATFWKDVILVLIGALGGYISGKENGK